MTPTAVLHSLLSQIVDHQDELLVTPVETDDRLLLQVSVHPSDRGRIIGWHGETAESLRTVMHATGGRLFKRVDLEIVGPHKT